MEVTMYGFERDVWEFGYWYKIISDKREIFHV